MISLRFRSLATGVLVLIGILLYFYTLQYEFVFDDCIYLVNNPLFRDIQSFAYPFDFHAFANKSVQLGLDRDLSTNLILRPVVYFTFYLNYALDGLNPRGYRAINILIHCTNAVLLFQLVWHLLQAKKTSTPLSTSSIRLISLGSALLFLVHPLQTESVTYVVQRFTSFVTLFYLLTLWTYFLAYSEPNPKKALYLRLASIVCLVIGMFSKEDTFTLPFVLVLLDWLVMDTSFKMACKRAIPYFACLPIIPALIVITCHAQEFGNHVVTSAFNVAIAGDSADYIYRYAITQLSVVLSYLRLILIPTGLNLDRDYPLSTAFFQREVLVSLSIIVGIIVCSWFYYKSRRHDVRSSLFFCSVLWFFITLCPSSSFAPLPDLMADHRSYLPSIGALLALVCIADMFRTEFLVHREGRIAMNVFMATWIGTLSIATVARNYVWRTPVSLLKDTAEKSPHKWRPWSNLAAAYYDIDKPREAVDCLIKTLVLEPNYIPGYIDLSSVQNELGRPREAIEVAKAGLKRASNEHRLLYNMAASYCAIEQMQNAIDALQQAIAICETFKPAHVMLGFAYTRLQQYDKALAEYKIAESLGPFDPQLRPKIIEAEFLASQRGSTR